MMIKLTNMSTHPSDKERFDNDPQKLSDYLRRNKLDGFEVSQCNREDMKWYPTGSVWGVHMRYWPICMDFFRGDIDMLRREFGSDDVWQAYYGVKAWDELVSFYREGLEIAQANGALYAVFHVSHSSLAECFTFSHRYSAREVADAFTALINEALDGFSGNITLLFENLWWKSGITLLDEPIALRMLENIRYPHKGFMLDIGHIMITNPALRSYRESAEYIITVLRDRPGVLSNIRGIHMNGALTGDYLQAVLRGEGMRDIEGTFRERHNNAYWHITKIDAHVPFADTAIRQVMELTNPDYLVFELLAADLPALERYISAQRQFCGVL